MKVSRSARKTLRTGVRWKKGQSSSSNPRCQRFREAASVVNRSRVVQFAPMSSSTSVTNAGNSFKITKAALQRHNQLIDEGDDSELAEKQPGDDDDSSVKSAETFATNFTGCTNQCFEKVLSHWADRQNSEARKTALAVLAAVAQLIRDRGGQETNEEYFQALLTALVSVDSSIRPAAAHLLSVLTRRMEPAALAPAFAPLTKACLQLLHSAPSAAEVGAENADASSLSSAGLPRSLLLCLGSAMASLPKTAWHSAATRQVLQAVLQFSQSDRPRIRKAAAQAIADTLASTDASVPVALTTAYALEQLRSTSSAVAASALRLLRLSASYQTERQAKATVESVLALAPTADAAIFAESMCAIRALFWRRRLDTCLSAALTGQIVNALYDARPPLEDAESTRIWLDTVRAGVGSLAPPDSANDEDKDNFDNERASILEAHINKLFSVAFRSLGQSGLTEAARKSCRDTCHYLLVELAPKLQRQAALASLRSTVLAALTGGLSSYQYYTAWPHVARLLAAFIRCHGSDCRGQADLAACLTSLASLRDSADDKDAALCACLESALAAALETLGPAGFLAAVQLSGLDPAASSDSWRRSWLLPLLPKHVRRGAELVAFSQHLLPLAKRCQAASSTGASPAARLLELQIWQALPAFCTAPADAKLALPALARQLGELLLSRPDIRLHLLAALRRLANAALEDSVLHSLMSGYAKNYMPRLFSLHSDTANATRSHRLAALETVRAYAPICPSELLANWFVKAVAKANAAMNEKNQADVARESADLAIALAPHLVDINPAVDLVAQWCGLQHNVEDKNAQSIVLEKKGYRLAESLLCAARKGRDNQDSQLTDSPAVSASAIGRLANLLVDAAAAGPASPSSRKSRLRCLALCVSNGEAWLASDSIGNDRRRQLAELALPEAVLGSREQNSQAREAADSLLLEVFRFYADQMRKQSQLGDGDDDGLDDGDDSSGVALGFLSAVFAAAGTDPDTLQAALYSVTGLLSHLRHCMNRSLLASLLRRLSDTMSGAESPRTLVKAALRCLASVVRKFGHAYTLEQVAECLEALPLDLRPAFRATVRRILTDLLAAFPYDALRSALPAFYHKQLNNVRKRTEHKERLKKSHGASGGADNADDASSVGRQSDVTRIIRGIDDILKMSEDSSGASDSDESKTNRSDKKSLNSRRRRKHSARTGDAAWLEEADDEILDLRDSQAASRIHRSKPPAQSADPAGKKRRLDNDFKLASDGRMIIEESDDDDGDDGDEQQSAAADLKAAKRRQKLAASAKTKLGVDLLDDGDDDDISGGVSSADSSSDDEEKNSGKKNEARYKPGGRGIHRDLKKTPQQQQQQRPVAKKKAKKPSDGLDPYSFLTLDRRLLNRKNVSGKLTRLGKYKSLVRSPAGGGVTKGGRGNVRKTKFGKRK